VLDAGVVLSKAFAIPGATVHHRGQPQTLHDTASGPRYECQTLPHRVLLCGEKRDFVAQVAAILALRFTEAAILYDQFHEAEFARYDLGVYLPGTLS